MITVLFYCTARTGAEGALRDLLADMQRVSRETDGAVSYTFMRQADDAREWALFEQWRDKAHLAAHVDSMKRHFGDPPDGARLPARMHALVERSRYTWYHALEPAETDGG